MGQLKRIVQNLFAFTTEKWGKITMISLKSIKSVKIKGNVCSKITVVLKHQLCPKVQSHLLSVKPTNNSSSQTIRLYNHMLFPSPQKVQTMICLTNLSWEITTVFISVCCQNLMGLADSVGVFASKISTPLRKFHYLLISSGSPLCMAAPSFRFQAFEENNVLRPLFDSEGKLMFKPMWFLVILSFPEVTKKRNFSLHYQCILVSEREKINFQTLIFQN